MSIGGQAALDEKYDRRRDYQAYAEGDMVEDESLMSPTGMNEAAMGTAEADMEMMAEEDAEFGDMDGVVDTSNLSPEEENKICDIFCCVKQKFSKLTRGDTLAVWYDIQLDNLVEINSLSEITGHKISYRYCNQP